MNRAPVQEYSESPLQFKEQSRRNDKDHSITPPIIQLNQEQIPAVHRSGVTLTPYTGLYHVLSTSTEQLTKLITQWAKDHLLIPAECLEVGKLYQTRRISATTIGSGNIWAARYTRASNTGVHRTYEFTMRVNGEDVMLGARTALTAPKRFLSNDPPCPPMVISDLAKAGALADAGVVLRPEPLHIDDLNGLSKAAKIILDPTRTLPVTLITGINSQGAYRPWFAIPPDEVASAVFGASHVIAVPTNLAAALFELIPEQYNSNRGSVRIIPTLGADTAMSLDAGRCYEFPRILSWTDDRGGSGSEGFIRALHRQLFYMTANPLTRKHFIGFAEIQQHALAQSMAMLTKSGDTQELVKTQQRRIASLVDELEYAISEADGARAEVERLSSKLEELTSRNDVLLDAVNRAKLPVISGSGTPPLEYPETFEDIADWIKKYDGRLIVLPRAIAATEKSNFADPPTLYSALDFLAREYREMRLATNPDARTAATARLRSLGLRLTFSAAESTISKYSQHYSTTFNGTRREFDLHLAKGNARDPRFALRVYFFFDEESGCAVVGHMPSHLVNTMT